MFPGPGRLVLRWAASLRLHEGYEPSSRLSRGEKETCRYCCIAILMAVSGVFTRGEVEGKSPTKTGWGDTEACLLYTLF